MISIYNLGVLKNIFHNLMGFFLEQPQNVTFIIWITQNKLDEIYGVGITIKNVMYVRQ